MRNAVPETKTAELRKWVSAGYFSRKATDTRLPEATCSDAARRPSTMATSLRMWAVGLPFDIMCFKKSLCRDSVYLGASLLHGG